MLRGNKDRIEGFASKAPAFGAKDAMTGDALLGI
jgi:hypothetical protein